MSEVGTPPPHNSDKPHGLVESINKNNNMITSIINITNIWYIQNLSTGTMFVHNLPHFDI